MALILASRSPRRAALLAAAGFDFEVGPFPDVDEVLPPGALPPEAARHIAERKSRAMRFDPRVSPDATVLTADTLVFLGDDEILGKPRDPEDACRMLARLSGTLHAVVTGVAVSRGAWLESGVAVTPVRFRSLEEDEIRAYVATGEPLDKAGAYGIQGGAASFVERREGPLDTVIGLPIALVVSLLARLGGGD